MKNKFIFPKIGSLFLTCLIFLSAFSVGVYGQDAETQAVSDEDVVETGEPIGNLYLCQNDGEYYDFVNRECRSAEFMGVVESPNFIEGMFQGMRYFLANDEAKSRLSAEISAEKVTALEAALDAGNYEDVKAIAEEFSQEMARAGEVMTTYYQEIDPGFY